MGNTDRQPLHIEIHRLGQLLDIDFERNGIKGIIFDYGGTIDNPGRHWSRTILDGYHAAGIDIPYTDFWEAYVYAERQLAQEGMITPGDNFLTLMRTKIRVEIEHLHQKGLPGAIYPAANTSASPIASPIANPATNISVTESVIEAIVQYCHEVARTNCRAACNVLDALSDIPEHPSHTSRHLPMAIVSNFYGNLTAVLKDYGIDHYFRAVIDSASVGLRKPDPAITQLGLNALALSPEEVIMVGDSVDNDIIPAQSIGLHTALLLGDLR